MSTGRCLGEMGAPVDITCERRAECARFAPGARWVRGETPASRLEPLRCITWKGQFAEFVPITPAAVATESQKELFA